MSYTETVTEQVDTGPTAQPEALTVELPTAQADSESAAALAPKSADEVTLATLSFDEIQKLIKGHKGKIVVMDCWSTSCEPCVKEFPNLVALHRKHGAAKVACISLSFDYEGLPNVKPQDVHPSVLKFLQEQKATFDNVLSNEDSESLYRKFDLASIPAVYVYDAEGKLAKRFDNEQIKKQSDAFTYKDVEALVAELLAKPGE